MRIRFAWTGYMAAAAVIGLWLRHRRRRWSARPTPTTVRAHCCHTLSTTTNTLTTTILISFITTALWRPHRLLLITEDGNPPLQPPPVVSLAERVLRWAVEAVLGRRGVRFHSPPTVCCRICCRVAEAEPECRPRQTIYSSSIWPDRGSSSTASRVLQVV